MGGEVADVATALQQSEIDRLNKAIFPATEATIVDPLESHEFYANDKGQRKMTMLEVRMCAPADKLPDISAGRLGRGRVPSAIPR